MKSLLALSIGISAIAISSSCLAATYKYDEFHRLKQVTYPNGAAALYTYDPAGNILTVSVELDLDGDLIPNVDDAFPFDPSESIDTDSDGTGNNADLDDDNDGAADTDESIDGTDALMPDVLFRLSPGLNLIALPIDGGPDLDSVALLRLLGDTVKSVRRYNRASGTFDTALSSDGDSATRFPINANEGYEVLMNSSSSLHISGDLLSGVSVLEVGPNLVGGAPPALKAFALLEQFGGADSTASLSRFNRTTGRFETATHDGVHQVGVNFDIRRGEAYWLWKKN